MNIDDWVDKAIKHINSMSSEEFYESFYGFKESDYIEYLESGKFDKELNDIISTIELLGGSYRIPDYGDSKIEPSSMFWSALSEKGIQSYDHDFMDGYGATVVNIPGSPLVHKSVNGQGTIHFFYVENK